MVNSTSKKLNIYLNGILVATLEKSSQGSLIFKYDKEWINLPAARPISLSMPDLTETYAGDLVYNFFDNLLPDNPYIRTKIQAKFKIKSSHPFDLLEIIGKDCIGALQILDNKNYQFSKTIDGRPLSKDNLIDIVFNYRDNPLGMSSKYEDFRISIAGAQEKTALLYFNKKWNIPLNDTPTTHIFKLPIGFIQHQDIDLRNSCENEWLCAEIARAFGFEVASCTINKFNNNKTLIVERFDRKLSANETWIMRLLQEDMCQALGVSANLKYQADGGPGIKEIMDLLLVSAHAEKDRLTFFRAQILFWLLCAIDGHAKNFSIFINASGGFSLTPLYDIISAYPLIAAKQLSTKKVKMAMALKGKNNHYKWCEGKRSHFIATGTMCGLSEKQVVDSLDFMLNSVDNVISDVKSMLPEDFPQEIAESIFIGMQNMRDKLLK